jgi:hypothetical protein
MTVTHAKILFLNLEGLTIICGRALTLNSVNYDKGDPDT